MGGAERLPFLIAEALTYPFQHLVDGGLLVLHGRVRTLESLDALIPVVCWEMRIYSSVWPPIDAMFGAVNF